MAISLIAFKLASGMRKMAFVPLVVAASKQSWGANMRRFVSKSLIFFLMFFFAIRSISDGSDGLTKWSNMSFQLPFSQILNTMRTLEAFEWS